MYVFNLKSHAPFGRIRSPHIPTDLVDAGARSRMSVQIVEYYPVTGQHLLGSRDGVHGDMEVSVVRCRHDDEISGRVSVQIGERINIQMCVYDVRSGRVQR